MRLQKLLASTGLGSRRGCEEIIAEGRVTVNGGVAELGCVVQPKDQVRVDGKLLNAHDRPVYIALHKPVGYISDFGSADRNKSALDLVKVPQRLYAVGRLDMDSSGLLLLTNDGDLAYRLTHPKFEHEKEYWALVEGSPNDVTVRRWRAGVLLHGETTKTAPAVVERRLNPKSLPPAGAGETWLRIVLHEGRKRQIRRMAKHLGHPVIQLIRFKIGGLELGNLKVGQWRELSAAEVKLLHATEQQ